MYPLKKPTPFPHHKTTLAFKPTYRFRIFSAACSATTMMYADGFAVTMPGKMLASTTNRLSVP